VKKFFQVALGIIAAIGGFVDIGELVFNTQAGAAFRFQLVWAVPVGVIGIVVFAEMTGRIATVSGRPIVDVVRMRMGLNVGLVTLVASLLINLITLAAEIGGAARLPTTTNSRLANLAPIRLSPSDCLASRATARPGKSKPSM